MVKRTNWKKIAIIFIILFIVETLLFIWLLNLGTEVLNKENECSINICGSEEYDAYYFDDIENICYCYKDNEIVFQEFIR